MITRAIDAYLGLATEADPSRLNPSNERYEFIWRIIMYDVSDGLKEFGRIIRAKTVAQYEQVRGRPMLLPCVDGVVARPVQEI